MKLAAVIGLGLAVVSAWGSPKAPHRQVAITIDDLPFVGEYKDFDKVFAQTQNLLRPIKEGKVPVTAFVIGKTAEGYTVDQRRDLFKLWLSAGCELGNHTWTHPDLNVMPLAEYEAQISHNAAEMHRLMGNIRFRYFRAPYLHEGADLKTVDGLHRFLDGKGYTDAPVTLDDDDYLFADVYRRALQDHDEETAKRVEEAYIPYMNSIVEFFEKRSKVVLGRECNQILLIHANFLNAKMMPALLQMFRDRGYNFITLQKALSDQAFKIPVTQADKNGISWIHRWEQSKGLPIVWEPEAPDWILKPNQKK